MTPLTLTVISIILVIIIAFLIISKILPLVKLLLDGLIRDNRSLAGFMSLLLVIIYVLSFTKIINLLLEIKDNNYLTYLNLITPSLDILNGILPYLQYILLGALIAWGFQNYKK